MVFFSYKAIYNKMNEETVRLFHKADWIDINFAIRSTMTKTTLNKMTIIKDEIGNYVNTLTSTITSAITENAPTKSIKRNYIGLPIEIRELYVRRDTRGDFGKGLEFRIIRQTSIVYRNELARTLSSERETYGKCTATIWSFPRVKMPPGVKSGQS